MVWGFSLVSIYDNTKHYFSTFKLIFSLALIANFDWILIQNLFAINLCLFAIKNTMISSFKSIFVLFVCFVIYDAFFVFHSEVMVTVAKQFDVPFKLII